MQITRTVLKLSFTFIFVLSLFSASGAFAKDENETQMNSPEEILTDAEAVSAAADEFIPLIEANLKTQISLSELKGLKLRIRQMSYFYVQSKNFIGAKKERLTRRYPEIIYLRGGLEVISWSGFFVFGALGHLETAALFHTPFVANIITGVFTAADLGVRKVLGKYLEKKYGIPASNSINRYKLRAFTNEDVLSINMHSLPEDFKMPTVNIGRRKHHKGMGEFEWREFISVNELEALINDPDFLNEARIVGLEGPLYEDILIQEILSKPELKKVFIARVESLEPQDKNEWNEWIRASETFLNRVRIDQTLNFPGIIAAIKEKRYSLSQNYILSYPDKIRIAKKTKAVEDFETNIVVQLLRGNEPDLEKTKKAFTTLREDLIKNIDDYKEKAWYFNISCQDIFGL